MLTPMGSGHMHQQSPTSDNNDIIDQLEQDYHQAFNSSILIETAIRAQEPQIKVKTTKMNKMADANTSAKQFKTNDSNV